MNWFQNTFFYREDALPTIQGLRGVAVLWFFHWSFFNQFDPAKLSRIAEGKPWLANVVEALRHALAPGEMTPVVIALLCGWLLARKQAVAESGQCRAAGDGVFARSVLRSLKRIAAVSFLAALPSLSYTQAAGPDVFRELLSAPVDFPQYTGFLAVIVAFKLFALLFIATNGLSSAILRTCLKIAAALALAAVFAGCGYPAGFWGALPLGYLAAGPGMRHAPRVFANPAVPCGLLLASACAAALLPLGLPAKALMAMALVSLAPTGLAVSKTFTARLVSLPVFRYLGVVALPFFLIHSTWGFRLSRSLLQGEMQSLATIAAHYALSLAFSAVFAGFLHIFFERGSFLRNTPAAVSNASSASQGATP